MIFSHNIKEKQQNIEINFFKFYSNLGSFNEILADVLNIMHKIDIFRENKIFRKND